MNSKLMKDPTLWLVCAILWFVAALMMLIVAIVGKDAGDFFEASIIGCIALYFLKQKRKIDKDQKDQ
jgi:hypothetical protein